MTWTPPQSVSLAERDAAKAYLIRMREEHPAPADGWLAARIATLLAHYWQDGDDVSMKTMIGGDWLECLEVLPKACIERACSWWRDNETRKPKPADIRRLTIEFFGVRRWDELMRVKKLTELPIINKARAEQAADPEARTDAKKAAVAELVHNATHKILKFADCALCQAEKGGSSDARNLAAQPEGTAQ